MKANYTTTILKFDKQGEKTGWTYIVVPADVAEEINPGCKKSFHVNGQLDAYKFSCKSLLPMGKGEFIFPLDAAIRKAIGKRKGAMVTVSIEWDKTGYELNADFMACLKDEPEALKFFESLTGSHRKYFSKWIDSAKAEETKAKRIAQSITAFLKKQGYPEMLREQKKLRGN